MNHDNLKEVFWASPSVRVSVIVPTLNPGPQAKLLVAALTSQSLPPIEIVMLDSASDDGSLADLSSECVRTVPVDRAKFHHASVRNLALTHTYGDYLCFLSQDALPIDKKVIERLVHPLSEGAAAAYARQVPRPSANPLERHARNFNYPPRASVEESRGQSIGNIRSVFFSNSCSMVRRDVFESMGGFPTHTIMNEDMILAARLLRAGHSVAYVADAIVQHSHDYTVWQTFRRYFDIGVVFTQARHDLVGREVTREGLAYVRSLFTTLWQNRDYAWIPVAFAESGAKWVGTFLGRRYKHLPLAVVKRLSMHGSYWNQTS